MCYNYTDKFVKKLTEMLNYGICIYTLKLTTDIEKSSLNCFQIIAAIVNKAIGL